MEIKDIRHDKMILFKDIEPGDIFETSLNDICMKLDDGYFNPSYAEELLNVVILNSGSLACCGPYDKVRALHGYLSIE